MANFDERSGVITSKASWGEWWQTLEEVCITINLLEKTLSKEIQCILKNKTIQLVVKDVVLIEGEFPRTIHAEDSCWTLEDKKVIRVVLVKSGKSGSDCWPSLLKGQYLVDPVTLDAMEKKLTLERFQGEHPGFDFSGATVSGNYQGGGPAV